MSFYSTNYVDTFLIEGVPYGDVFYTSVQIRQRARSIQGLILIFEFLASLRSQ